MLRVLEREAAEDRVAIVSNPQADVPLVREMFQPGLGGQQLGLGMLTRPWHTVIDFLQERHVSLTLLNRVDNSPQVVTPVDAADAFVDVVAQQAEVHGTGFSAAIRATVSSTSCSSVRLA